MSQRYQLDIGSLSDMGQVRELNEDYWGVFDEIGETLDLPQDVVDRKGRLYAVADGMGGHAAGEVASRRAIFVLFQHYYDDPDVDLGRSLERAYWAANSEIYAQAASNVEQSGMGTTLVTAVVQDDELLVANVGDSRAYLVHEDQTQQVSRDHSWVNEQVEAGLLTEAEAQTHIYRNIITRSMGSRPDVDVDTFSLPLQIGDGVVLCTDGLSNEIQPDEMARIVSQAKTSDEAAAALIELANERGGSDNQTVIVIKVVSTPQEKASLPWVAVGALAVLVLAGIFSLCLSAGLVPAYMVPQYRYLRSTLTPLHTPATGVVPTRPGPVTASPIAPSASISPTSVQPPATLGTRPETAAHTDLPPVASPGSPVVETRISVPVTVLPPVTLTVRPNLPTLPAFGWQMVITPSNR